MTRGRMLEPVRPSPRVPATPSDPAQKGIGEQMANICLYLGPFQPLLSGELWIVDVSTLVRTRVGGSHCRTPVFANDDKSILALCQGGLTQISLESMEAHELTTTPSKIERLLATDRTSEPNGLRIVVVTPQGFQ
jgi:hypothetical protein